MINTTIKDRIAGIRKTEPTGGGRLRVFPLLGDSAEEPAYRLLDQEALDFVQIGEIDEGGSVPELLVENGLDVLLYLPSGQGLVGAKQNRALNSDVLVPPKTKLRIPVSCVEQGRWSRPQQAMEPMSYPPSPIRASKSRSVHESLSRGDGHRSDQGKVWSDVQDMLCSHRVASPTSAMHDAYVAKARELKEVRESLELPPGTVGVAAYQGDRFLGLDLFDRETTMRAVWDGLVSSYGLSALADLGTTVADAAEAPAKLEQILDEIATTDWERHDSPGAGDDWRLASERMIGSALLWEDRSVVHLQLFPPA